ncbi:MAG: universal stress protein [Rhodoferax sp.]
MKILLPFDGSSQALAAVRFAIRLADSGLEVHAVLANVQEPASLYELLVAHDPAVIATAAQEAGRHLVQAAQALLEDAQVPYTTELATGDPAHTLVDILENHGCELVIMGASGTSRLRRALLGSVSNEVLHASGVPVMIVKSEEAA